MLEEFGRDGGQAQRACRQFLEAAEVVAGHFGHTPEDWQAGRRVNDASRALAAYLARRRFGYSAAQVAAALGYRGHGGVSSAVARIESSGPALRDTAEELAQRLRKRLTTL